MISKILAHYPAPEIATAVLVIFFLIFTALAISLFSRKNKTYFEEHGKTPLK
jgi:cbb3-type cytochrome oxidase subunit 3